MYIIFFGNSFVHSVLLLLQFPPAPPPTYPAVPVATNINFNKFDAHSPNYESMAGQRETLDGPDESKKGFGIGFTSNI